MAPTGQPDNEVATVSQPECIDEMNIPVKAIDIDQQPIPNLPHASPDNDPPVIECRSTAKPALAPGTANTAGSIDSVKTSSAPDQVTPAPLYVPDLSLAPGQKAAGTRPEASTADEVIDMEAASNPTIEQKPEWKMTEATT